MTNKVESEGSSGDETSREGSRGWLRFAVLTAASAVAGGIATAWFYRKTLERLRETGENPQNPHFSINRDEEPGDPSDEI
jgi:hypothetical protein